MLTDFVIPVSHALVYVLWQLSLTRLMFGEFGPPTASSFGHWCTAGVLPRTTSAPYKVQDDSPRGGPRPEATGRGPPHSPPLVTHVQEEITRHRRVSDFLTTQAVCQQLALDAVISLVILKESCPTQRPNVGFFRLRLLPGCCRTCGPRQTRMRVCSPAHVNRHSDRVGVMRKSGSMAMTVTMTRTTKVTNVCDGVLTPEKKILLSMWVPCTCGQRKVLFHCEETVYHTVARSKKITP